MYFLSFVAVNRRVSRVLNLFLYKKQNHLWPGGLISQRNSRKFNTSIKNIRPISITQHNNIEISLFFKIIKIIL